MAQLVAGPTPERHLAARRFLEDAVQRDPYSAESWSQLAALLANDHLNNWNEAKGNPKAGKELLGGAEKAVQEALKIDSAGLGAPRGRFYPTPKRRSKGALDAFDRAI